MRATSAASQTAAGPVAAEQSRIRRLFAVLDDVASYSAGYAGANMLAHAWDMVSEFVEQRPPAGCRLLAAVRDVGAHEVGSSGWWLAVRSAAQLIDAQDTDLTCGCAKSSGSVHCPAGQRNEAKGLTNGPS